MTRLLFLAGVAAAAVAQSIPKSYQFAGFANLSPTMGRPLSSPIVRAIPGKNGEAYVFERDTGVLFRLDYVNDRLTEIVVNPPLGFADSVDSIAVDSSGNVYLPDSRRLRVMRVTPFGDASVFARTASAPYLLAMDPAGNLFVAEAGGGVDTIKRIDAQGAERVILARPGTNNVRNMTTDRRGNLYLLLRDANPILVINPAGVAVNINRRDDPVLLASRVRTTRLLERFGFLSDIAVGLDNAVYLADAQLNLIWKIGPNGYTTIESGRTLEGTCVSGGIRSPCIRPGYFGNGAVNGQEQYFAPASLSMDASGRLLIAETGNGTVRLLTRNESLVTVAGQRLCCRGEEGIPAAQATFGLVRGLTTDVLGNIYAADPFAGRVRKIDLQGNISTVLGDGSLTPRNNVRATESGAQPFSVAVDSTGVVYVAEPSVGLIRQVQLDGTVQTLSGPNSGVFPLPRDLPLFPSEAGAVAIGPDDTLYSLGACNVFRWAGGRAQPMLSGTCADRPSGSLSSAAIDRPIALTVDRNGAVFISTLVHGMRVIRDGRLETAPDIAPRRGLSRATHLHAGRDGYLYATSSHPPHPLNGSIQYRVAYALSPAGIQYPISVNDYLNNPVISPFSTGELLAITTDIAGRVIVSQRGDPPLLIYPKVSQ